MARRDEETERVERLITVKYRLHRTNAKPSSKEMMAGICWTWLGNSMVAVAVTGLVRGRE